MKTIFIFFSSIVLFFCISVQTRAQVYEVGAGVGVLHYKGTVTPRFKPLMARPGANIFFRYNFSRAVSFKAGGMIGSFYGDDATSSDPFQRARNFKFSTDVKEVYTQIEYNFLNFRTNASRIVSDWTPYVFAGIAGSLWQIQSTSYNYLSLTYQKEDVSKERGIVLPFGIGFKQKINDNWNWGVEFGTRLTFTDQIDHLANATNYTQSNGAGGLIPLDLTIPSNFNQVKFAQGNRPLNDMYYYTNISISYVFYRVACPNPKH